MLRPSRRQGLGICKAWPGTKRRKNQLNLNSKIQFFLFSSPCTSAPTERSPTTTTTSPTSWRGRSSSTYTTTPARYKESPEIKNRLFPLRDEGSFVVLFNRGGSSLGSGSKAQRLKPIFPGSGSAQTRRSRLEKLMSLDWAWVLRIFYLF